jgi:hypothetical protein
MAEEMSLTTRHVPAPPPSAPWPAWSGWLLLALLFLVEYGLFREYAVREITWAYPTNHDQSRYLGRSYDTYEKILERGLAAGVRYGVNLSVGNGMMLHLQGALIYLILGPARLSALTLNLLYYVLLQGVMAGTVRWYTGRWSLALLAVGLLLATNTLFNPAGGLMDFRNDCITMCLFGILLSLCLRSRLFASWGWSCAVGGVAGLLLLFRFLSTLYLVSILGTLLLFLCGALCVRCRDAVWRRHLLCQLRGLVTAGLIALVLGVPVVCSNLDAIRAYYVDHLHNGENDARSREYGVHDALSRLLYYPRSVARDHAGKTFFVLAGVALAGACVARGRRPGAALLSADLRRPSLVAATGFAGVCLALPMTIQTLYASPSPVVGGIVVPALVWLVVLAAAGLARTRWMSEAISSRTRWLAAVATLIVVVGFYAYAQPLTRRGWLSRSRPDVERIVELYDEIGRYSKQCGWTEPKVSCNFLNDYLPPYVLPTVYERQRVLVNNAILLPEMISPVTEEEAIEAIRKSDFVVLNMAVPTSTEHPFNKSPYPFMKSMYAMRPRLVAECEKHFVLLKHFELFGDDVALYARPQDGTTGPKR